MWDKWPSVQFSVIISRERIKINKTNSNSFNIISVWILVKHTKNLEYDLKNRYEIKQCEVNFKISLLAIAFNCLTHTSSVLLDSRSDNVSPIHAITLKPSASACWTFSAISFVIKKYGK